MLATIVENLAIHFYHHCEGGASAKAGCLFVQQQSVVQIRRGLQISITRLRALVPFISWKSSAAEATDQSQGNEKNRKEKDFAFHYFNFFF
jgi:hypothetical protein